MPIFTRAFNRGTGTFSDVEPENYFIGDDQVDAIYSGSDLVWAAAPSGVEADWSYVVRDIRNAAWNSKDIFQNTAETGDDTIDGTKMGEVYWNLASDGAFSAPVAGGRFMLERVGGTDLATTRASDSFYVYLDGITYEFPMSTATRFLRRVGNRNFQYYHWDEHWRPTTFATGDTMRLLFADAGQVAIIQNWISRGN